MLKIKIVELKKEDLSKELAEKYFKTAYGQEADRFYIPKLTNEAYTEFIKSYLTKSKKPINNDNLNLETATQYFKDKARKELIAKDLGISVNYIDFKDYQWSDADHEFGNENYNLAIRLDPYMTPSLSTKEYVDYKVSVVDVKLFNELWRVCYKAITTYKAMMLEFIEKLINLLINIQKYTDGFKTNCTKQMSASMRSYYTKIKTLLSDKEYIEWYRTTSDVELFMDNESTCRLFTETYLKLFELIGEDFTKTDIWDAAVVKSKYDIFDYIEYNRVEYKDFCNDREDDYDKESYSLYK